MVPVLPSSRHRTKHPICFKERINSLTGKTFGDIQGAPVPGALAGGASNSFLFSWLICCYAAGQTGCDLPALSGDLGSK
jgi:hypothetical protein